MKFQTIFGTLLLFCTLNITSCGASKAGATGGSVAEAEEIMAQKNKAKQKEAAKAKKASHKRYWSLQSKAAKKSVKKNLKRQRKLARQRKG
jgi:hypothetical protein